jgi:hypothetical protein
MVRCTGCADADWESFWTSYTFASADPSGKAVAAPSMLAPKPPGPWLRELAELVQRWQQASSPRDP